MLLLMKQLSAAWHVPLAETLFRSTTVRLETVFRKRWYLFSDAVFTEENRNQLSVWRTTIDVLLLKETMASHLFPCSHHRQTKNSCQRSPLCHSHNKIGIIHITYKKIFNKIFGQAGRRCAAASPFTFFKGEMLHPCASLYCLVPYVAPQSAGRSFFRY